jgi:hypothetical protein
VQRLCDDGARIEILECQGKGHQDSQLASFPYIHAWTQARLAGAAWDPAAICSIGPPVDCTALP